MYLQQIRNAFCHCAWALIFSLSLAACGGGSSNSSSEEATPNSSPTASAGSDQTVDEQTMVTLSGSGSDSDGSIISYQWVQTSGSSVTFDDSSAITTFSSPSIDADETLTFKLTVTDDDGATDTDTVSISVIANIAPTSNAGLDQTVYEQTSVTISGLGIDEDGSIESYQWIQTAGTSATLADSSSTYTTFTVPDIDTDEILTFELTVTDDDGDTGVDSVSISVIAGIPLNDTGIIACADDSDNDLDCPVTNYPNQDAEYGRDTTDGADSDGYAGFSFTKLDENGDELEASATEWSCVKDNVTGLIWEVKTIDSGLRDAGHTYTWYSSDDTDNGGDAGIENGGICFDSENCDTEKFVEIVNQTKLCGATDWRMPTREELHSIIDYSSSSPSIDTDYFPNTVSDFHMSSSTFAKSSSNVWGTTFDDGADDPMGKNGESRVRLVR